MRKRRLTGFSPPPSSGEHSRRPVSWHESLCERLPDREEWQAQSVFRSNQSGVASGIRLPAIKVLEGLPTVQEDRPALRASNASYSRSDPFQNSMRAPAQPMSSLAKQPQILPPERIPRSGSDPIHRALQSPHPLHERTKPIDPWSPHSAPGYATSNAPLQSPHDGGFPRFGSNDYGHDMETRSPGRSWYYVEERTVRPPGYQRTHHREQAASAACQSEPLRNVSPQSAGTTTVHQQNTPSISPMQEAMGTRDFELPRSMDSRNFTLSAHTSPVSQYNWETPDPLADASNRRRRGNLPKESTAVLNTWFCQHVAYPYPKEEEKHRLQTETGLSMSQVRQWAANSGITRILLTLLVDKQLVHQC